MKKKITEKQLNQIICESVKAVLNESELEEGFFGKAKGFAQGVGRAAKGEAQKFNRGIRQTGLDNEYQGGQNFGQRFKSTVKNSMNSGDATQDLQNIVKQLQSASQNKWLSEKNAQLANQLIAGINQQIKMGKQSREDAVYKKNYGTNLRKPAGKQQAKPSTQQNSNQQSDAKQKPVRQHSNWKNFGNKGNASQNLRFARMLDEEN